MNTAIRPNECTTYAVGVPIAWMAHRTHRYEPLSSEMFALARQLRESEQVLMRWVDDGGAS